MPPCKNAGMLKLIKAHRLGILAWVVLCAVGSAVLGRLELAQTRDAFETDARIVHRLLSQRAVQHDAILATLALLQAGADNARPEQRLPAVYPQILTVRRRDRDAAWDEPRFAAADIQSRTAKRAVLADTDFANGRYWVVLHADTSYAMQIDMRSLVQWSEWPMRLMVRLSASRSRSSVQVHCLARSPKEA